VKKQNNSLTIKINRKNTDTTLGSGFLLLIPGSMLLAGMMGILVQELELGVRGYWMLTTAVPGLFLGLFLQWEKRWQAILVVGFLSILILCSIFFAEPIADSIASLLEKISRWRLVRTGRYTMPYEKSGSIIPILLLAGVGIGLGAAWLVRTKSVIGPILAAFVFLIGWMLGLLKADWPLCTFLLGTLLILAKYASGLGRTVFYAGSLTLAVTMCLAGILWIGDFTAGKNNVGKQVGDMFHSWYWEKSNNPLPEGNLSKLNVYKPSDEAALEVTMQHWTPLYLRGYVAGNYTEDGWEMLDTEEIIPVADALFVLQNREFFAADQIAAAWQSVQEESENAISVQVLGACRKNVYLPYGAGNVTEGLLSAEDLLREGTGSPEMNAYGAELYPVEKSYLLQKELADTGETSYRSAESVYRNWVYEQYLKIPEETYEVLKKYLMVNGEISTSQAKKEISELLEQRLSYEENIVTEVGDRDFASYVLEVSRQGYSVHFATLTTLLMRYCGIPARYVEGYVVIPSQAEALTDGAPITLTQRNAHAWTEYYLDGVGWIPFDTTPGYEEILEYELPPEGLATDHSDIKIASPSIPEKQNDSLVKTPNVEEEKIRQSQQIYIRQMLHMLILLPVIIIIVLIVRMFLLRYRLRKQQKVFYGKDYRRSCAAVLSYLQELADSLGHNGKNRTSKELAESIALLLDKEADVLILEEMLNEVWFSHHKITEEQQQTALLWLEEAKQTWKRKLPAVKRVQLRYVACRIL